MKINMKAYLRKHLERQGLAFDHALQLPDVTLEPQRIRAVMINEVVPADPADDFYGSATAGCLETVVPLFHQAGIDIRAAGDLLPHGIYLTSAVRTPKSAYTIETATIRAHMPVLAHELALFPRLRVVMLMGDVAKKAFNMLARQASGRNAIPAGSTYKLRQQIFHHDAVRVLPSYIMTGKNILIEKSKFAMATEDIRCMLAILAEKNAT